MRGEDVAKCLQIPLLNVLAGFYLATFLAMIFQTSVMLMLINFSGQLLIDKHATFLISHQEEDTALLFLPKKCEVSERHVACSQELLGFKPGTSILLVHNSLCMQNEKSRESCARCIRHPKAALLRTSSHVSISNHMMLTQITLNYSVSFWIIYSSIYIYIHMYIYIIMWYCTLKSKLL